ncbi:MAG: prolyl oligopeptidase family serine peptidase [Phycisphaerales bacterium]|jgi:lysophospholipase L1-like esterase/dienelactone hydrolase|nr:prolyl oligopeptidase family serine peptidase [Phycisphaerales bacterium]MBT7171633.1 prolyl oligopeptidase family serine peptidase [Phycisphaerales bacterium]
MNRRIFLSLSAILFASSLALGHCGSCAPKAVAIKTAAPKATAPKAAAPKAPIRIACVGDSITVGVGVKKNRKAKCYPGQIQSTLGRAVVVGNFGVSARTMLKKGDHPIWKEKAYTNALAFKPDVVTIMLGTNDSKPHNWKHKAEFAADVKAMVAEFRALPSNPKIYLILPVPAFPGSWGITDKVIKGEIIPILKQVAKETKCATIDLHTPMEDKKQFFPDKVHPNLGGATEMAKILVKELGIEPAAPQPAAAPPAGTFPGKVTKFGGFDCHKNFKMDGMICTIAKPKTAAKGNPWVIRARFWGHQAGADIELLKLGYHIAYCDVANRYGDPVAVERWNKFYTLMTKTYGMNKQVALEGMSRGGLIIFNWAKANPEKVSCIYGDNPVCDIRSWPGGQTGKPYPSGWKVCKKLFKITDETAKDFKGNPIDGLEPLAKAKVPVLLILGTADKVVPNKENGSLLAERYKKLGGSVTIITKPSGHHPHALENPKRIVDFITKHTAK